eukprot:12424875-Karenia_brevis.AAC.1
MITFRSTQKAQHTHEVTAREATSTTLNAQNAGHMLVAIAMENRSAELCEAHVDPAKLHSANS